MILKRLQASQCLLRWWYANVGSHSDSFADGKAPGSPDVPVDGDMCSRCEGVERDRRVLIQLNVIVELIVDLVCCVLFTS